MTGVEAPIHVLHVDDEPGFGEMAASFLEREHDGLSVRTVTSADAGLELLREAEIDCIVSDYDMPEQDGIEFLQAVRREFPDLPFILYTGKGSEEIASEAISTGVTDYLQKESGTGQYAVLANRITNAVEQYRARHELELSQQRLSLFIEQSPLGVLEWDTEFNIVRANDAAGEILGYSPTELRGKTWKDVVSSASYDDVDELTSALGESEGGFHSVDENVRKDGERIVCEWHNRTVTDDDGAVVAIFSLFQDITERKERKRRLERSTARLEALFENSPDMIDIHTEDGTIVDVNEQFCAVFGQPEDELVGQKVWDIDRRSDPQELRAMWADMAVGDRVKLETEFHTDDGVQLPVEVHLTRLPVADGDRFMVVSRDISDRRARIREIEDLKERLEFAVEGANLGVWDWNLETDEVEFNEQWAAMLGYSLDDIDAHFDAWEARTHPDDLPAVEEALDAHFAGETLYYETEHRMRTADGEWKWIRDIGKVVERDDDGDPVRAVGIHLDIDDRKQRERELERTYDLLEQTEHIANVGGWELDVETQELFWTDYVYELFQFEQDAELTLDGAIELFHEDDQETVGNAVEAALAEGEAFDIVVRFRRPDGDRRWVQVLGEPTVEDGVVVNLRGAVQDITERRERERELQQAREEYEELFNGMNDAALVVGSDETFRAVNDAAVDTLGYAREELLTMSPQDIDIALDDDEISALHREKSAGEMEVFETVHETKSGDRLPVEVSSSLLSHRGETGALSIVRDISDRKQREEQLEEFASIVSHDLRNPLTVAAGRLELARQDCDSEHLAAIEQSLERMSSLIESLLTLAREGDRVGEKARIELAPLVDECWANVSTADATLRVETDRAVWGDRSRLQQLLENLIRNAVEHGSTGNRKPAASSDAVEHGSTGSQTEPGDAVEHGAAGDGEPVTVTVGSLDDGFYVEDDGPGIPAAERDDVFDHGYSTSQGGTGLGLTIVARIAEAHDWEIRATEGSAGGARFEITGVDTDA